MRGLTQLEPGEEWLLKPQQNPDNPQLWSPGIKLGVRRGGFTHTTELFGPVLGLMRADNLAHAIQLANSTPYGLTSGIHTLDEREKNSGWKRSWQEIAISIAESPAPSYRDNPLADASPAVSAAEPRAGGPNYIVQMMQPTADWHPKKSR